MDAGAAGGAAGAGDNPAMSKTGKYIAPGLREGAANRRGETMPRTQRGMCLQIISFSVHCMLMKLENDLLLVCVVV